MLISTVDGASNPSDPDNWLVYAVNYLVSFIANYYNLSGSSIEQHDETLQHLSIKLNVFEKDKKEVIYNNTIIISQSRY